MGLNTAWFIDVSDDKKEDTESAIRNSTIVLRQLEKIIQAEIKRLDITKLEEDYSTASWAYKQADRLGQLRSLRKLLTIVSLNK